MSGICGIWHRDGRPVAPEELARMSEAIRHRGPDGERRWISGNAGFAFQAMQVTPEAARADQPILSPSGAVVMFDGRLDNRDELLDLLGGRIELNIGRNAERNAADCEYVAAAYEAFADDVFARLLGDFAIAIFDPEKRKLLLARDRMGLRPLYYCVADDTVLFGSETKAILAHPLSPLRPNNDALADYLMPGDVSSVELTFFADVFRVVPGSVLQADPRRAAQRKYWDFDARREIRYPEIEQYSDHLRELVTRAVERRRRSALPVAVSVSGGLDSSGIYCLLQKSSTVRGAPVMGFHIQFGAFEEASEERYVKELELATGEAIRRFPATIGFMNGVEACIWHTEAPITSSQANTVRTLCAFVHQQGARLFLDGQFGDYVLTPAGYVTDLFLKLRWRTLRQHLHTQQDWMQEVPAGVLGSLLRLRLARALMPDALLPAVRAVRNLNRHRHPLWFTPAFRRHAMRRALWQAPLRGAFHSQHARALYSHTLWPRFFHGDEIANKNLAQFCLETAAPFMDRDLVAFVMAIPGEIVNLGGVPKGLYREAMRGILPEPIRLRRTKGDFARFNNQEAKLELPAIGKHLGPNCLGVQMGYLDRDALGDAIERIAAQYGKQQSAEPSRRLTALIGLELWLQIFFGRPRGEIAQAPQAPMAISQAG